MFLEFPTWRWASHYSPIHSRIQGAEEINVAYYIIFKLRVIVLKIFIFQEMLLHY